MNDDNNDSDFRTVCWVAGIAIVLAVVFFAQSENYKYRDCLRETASYPEFGGHPWSEFCANQ